jgi:hypothetical protein
MTSAEPAPPGLARVSSQTSTRKSAARRPGLMALILLVAGTGCTAYQPTRSGYLSDYSGLQKDPFHLNYGLGLERNQSHNADLGTIGQIDSYYIEPPQWLVSESSRGAGHPERQEMLLLALQEQLKEQLSELRPVVDQPGPNTARVRSAITEVKLSRPILNTAILATAFTPLIFGTTVFIGPIFNGGGFVEAEVIGPDGRQLSAISCASGGGMIDITGYYLKFGHAKKAMRRAAQELRETLEP